jgi:CHRD domain-containing protein
MISRHTLLRTFVVASVVAATLAACGQMRPSRKLDIFDATLSGAQEVPPVSTPATGSAEVSLNNNTNLLTWKVTYMGLSGVPTGAHIHGPAAPGQNAGVVVPFTAVTAQPIMGQATLTPQQVNDLAAGLWYVNIHTPNNPNGEIRGQLRRRQ